MLPVGTSIPTINWEANMAEPAELLSALIVLEFVVVAAVVFLLVPIEAAVSLIPLFLLFSFVLYKYLR